MLIAADLLADAKAATGLSDLGDDSILEGLDVLVEAMNMEARLSARGEENMRGLIHKQLVNRLRVEDYLKSHPGLLERPVERPTFVFGLPRTGTTLFINLLDSDPARRCFLRWESQDSVPPMAAGGRKEGERYEREKVRLKSALVHAPQICAIHYEDPDGPTECQFSMSQSFCAQVFEANAYVPTYRKWFLEADYLPAMRYHKRLLQLLQENAGGHWTLKNPWHPLLLDALTTVYPDAQLVMTHRDPLEVVGSACSLIKEVRKLLSDHVDLEAIGASMMEMFEIMIARSEKFRAERGQDAIYDVLYSDLMRDPIGTMKALYSHFGEPWTEAAESGMRVHLEANPKGRHGKHTYDIGEFGITEAQVRERFADYCRKYAIATRN
ncbi:MAG: sulfotransferase [Pigmentiphaga sp.]